MIEVIPIQHIPIVRPGDNIFEVVYKGILENNLTIKSNDIIVIAHKIISRATNRLIKLSNIKPDEKSIEIAKKMSADPRKVQAILNESKRIVKSDSRHLIMESNLGFICANSGVDRSNSSEDESVILLPDKAQEICINIRCYLEKKFNCRIGVIISDTHGRALRRGAQGIAIAVSGIPAIISYEGKKDIFGYKLQHTKIAVADEIASAAELVMGEADEKIPVALIRGLKYKQQENDINDLIYSSDESLFY